MSETLFVEEHKNVRENVGIIDLAPPGIPRRGGRVLRIRPFDWGAVDEAGRRGNQLVVSAGDSLAIYGRGAIEKVGGPEASGKEGCETLQRGGVSTVRRHGDRLYLSPFHRDQQERWTLRIHSANRSDRAYRIL